MGKTIPGEGRTLILNVLKFFEMEKANKQLSIPINKVIKRTCAATGISKSTLMTIKREAKQFMSQSGTTGSSAVPQLPTPGKKRKQSAKKIVLNNVEVSALKDIVSSFYTLKKENPTLNKILAVAKQDLNFKGKKSTLRSILIDQLGYKFKKSKNPDMAAWRARCQRRKKEKDLCKDIKPATYLDETWIHSHSHYTMDNCWQNNTDSSILNEVSAQQPSASLHNPIKESIQLKKEDEK